MREGCVRDASREFIRQLKRSDRNHELVKRPRLKVQIWELSRYMTFLARSPRKRVRSRGGYVGI